MDRRLKLVSWAAVVLFGTFAGMAYLLELANNRHHIADSRAAVQDQLLPIRARLEGALYADIQLARGLVGVVAANPRLDQERFSAAARALFGRETRLRAVTAAPEMTIRMAYPLAANKEVIGADLRRLPAHFEAADRARRTGRIVVAGPIDLLQGGTGFIGRIPVYLDGPAGQPRFWGLVSAVIAMEDIYRASGLLDPALAIEVAIRGKDAAGPDGEVFFGRAGVFDENPVLADIPLPDGAWRIAAIPRGGWPTQAGNAWKLRLGFLLVGLLMLGPFVGLRRSIRALGDARSQVASERGRLSATLENAPNVAVQWFDREGRVLYWNRASELLYGWRAAEAEGETIDRLTGTSEDALAFSDILRQLGASGETLGPAQFRARHRDGSPLIVSSTIFRIPADGSPVFARMDVDVTSRAEAESALQQAGRRQDAIVALLRIGLEDRTLEDTLSAMLDIVVGSDWPHTVSGAGLLLAGERGGDLVLKAQRNLEPELPAIGERIASGRCACGHAVGHREIEFVECEPESGGGGTHAARGVRCCIPVLHGNRSLGVIVACHAAADRDVATESAFLRAVADIVAGIVDRKLAERHLRDSEQKLRSLFDLSPVGIALNDYVSGRFVEVNDALTAATGYSREQLQAMSYWDLLPWEYGQQEQPLLDAMNRTGGYGPYEMEYIRKDGSRYPVLLHGVKLTDAAGREVIWSIVQDISGHKQVEREIRRARDAAESASRAKSEFLASMSHELRTPLNAVIGFAQMLDMGVPGPLLPPQKEAVSHILGSGRHLLELINDTIDLARIEAGKLELSMVAVPVKALVEESMAMVASLARKHGVALVRASCDCDLEPITVRADYVRLRQVVINLLSNAIKYNRPQGKVELGCGKRDGRLRIVIADTGPGIAADKQSRVFSAFDRLGEERGSVEGTGIGLVITQRLVDAMGGTIGFESVEGKGSTFWIEFAVGAIAMPQTRTSRGAESSSCSSVLPCVRKVIIHVEDNAVSRRLIQHVFAKRADIELRDAATAAEGIALARAAKPALILMDINLPDMSGLDALAILKADPATAAIPVVAVTANAMKGDMERGRAAGFDDYLTKPVDIRLLFGIIDRIVAKSGADRDAAGRGQ
jgi:PAS domain S-box-containing protein